MKSLIKVVVFGKEFAFFYNQFKIQLMNVSYDNAFDKRCEARQMRRRLEEILDTPFMKQLK